MVCTEIFDTWKYWFVDKSTSFMTYCSECILGVVTDQLDPVLKRKCFSSLEGGASRIHSPMALPSVELRTTDVASFTLHLKQEELMAVMNIGACIDPLAHRKPDSTGALCGKGRSGCISNPYSPSTGYTSLHHKSLLSETIPRGRFHRNFKSALTAFHNVHHILSETIPRERFHRNFKSALTAFHNVHHKQWDSNLTWLQLAFNTALHESQKSTPSKVLLGYDPIQSINLEWEIFPAKWEEDSSQTPRERWERASTELKRACGVVAKRYNQSRYPVPYKVGDKVGYRVHQLNKEADGIAAKLCYRWSEPTVIKRLLTSVAVQLKDPETGLPTRKAHVTQLKPCQLTGGEGVPILRHRTTGVSQKPPREHLARSWRVFSHGKKYFSKDVMQHVSVKTLNSAEYITHRRGMVQTERFQPENEFQNNPSPESNILMLSGPTIETSFKVDSYYFPPSMYIEILGSESLPEIITRDIGGYRIRTKHMESGEGGDEQFQLNDANLPSGSTVENNYIVGHDYFPSSTEE
uniref:Uncharacterized protein n=1 Tax=Timema poppense TaxID=170557 RepID=A0A7R9CQL9_TIMPO|nr:unnamed protein product [Timema poppensis]